MDRRRSSRLKQGLSEGEVPKLVTLQGLLAAQRFSKGLKKRTAKKLAAKKEDRKPVTITYEQVPPGSAQPEVKFPDTRMSQLMQDLLEFRLNGVNCIPTSAGVLAQELSEALVRLARTVSPPRYKLLCIVTLGQSSQGGVVLVSQALWDCHSDTSVSHTFHGPRMFCTATVFAVYHE